MRLLAPATSALLALAGIAFAQQPPAPSKAAPPKAAPPKTEPAKSASLSADMEATLRKAGFTELQIMPNSVFVRGKDKAGNPVAMVLNPGSMTEMVTLDPHSGPAAAGNGAPLTGTSTFVTVLPSEKLASKIIGTDVAGRQGELLGTIRDLAVDHGGVHAYVVRVSGLFGLGEKFAAVAPTAIDLTFDKASGHFHATMDATADQMKAAPEFKYGDGDQATK